MGSGPCRITMTLEATLLRFEVCLARKQQQVEEQKKSRGQVKRWRTRQGVLQVKVASPTSEAGSIAVDAEFEEVLRDLQWWADSLFQSFCKQSKPLKKSQELRGH